MARPTRYVLAEGRQAWDTEVDANFALMTQAPVPFHEEASVSSLTTNFPPANFEDCICIVDGKQYISDGTTWELYYPIAANVADSTATTTSQMASDLNDLLAALQAAGIMATS